MSLTISDSSRVIVAKRRLDHNQPEVVDDSEPEREEARNRRKEERRKQKEKAKASNAQLIELTDSDSLDTTCVRSIGVTNCIHDSGVTPPPVDILVNELSKGYDRNRCSVSKAMKTSTTTLAKHPANRVADNIEDLLPIPDSQSLTITDDGLTSDEIDEKTVSMPTRLGSFAFSASSRTSSTLGNSFRPTKQVVGTTKPPNFKSSCSPGSAGVYLDFSDRQLQALLKCVSCDLKWTTRKSSGVKATHMRACAKKARLAEETMSILITREISTTSDLYTKPQPGKTSGGDCVPKTFFEDLVKDADCPPPGKRRKEFRSSIKTIAESQDDIRHRARAILHEPCFGRSTKDKLEGEASQPLLATQTFEKSSLATSMAVSSYSNMDDGPPLTQALPGSSLGSAFSTSRTTLHPFDVMTECPPLTLSASQSTIPRRSRSSLLTSEMNGDAVSSHYSPSLRSSNNIPEDSDSTCNPDDMFLYVSEDDNDEDSDAILVFDPAMREDTCDPVFDEEPANNDTSFDNTPFVRTPTAKHPLMPPSNILETLGFPHLTREDNASMQSKAGSSDVFTADRTFAKAISPRKRHLKQIKGQNANREDDEPTISDADFFETFKAMVLEDEALYRRILCYEPIRFELFLDMVQERVKEYNLGPLDLKLKLKEFLDQQAIHYCEGSWNRR